MFLLLYSRRCWDIRLWTEQSLHGRERSERQILLPLQRSFQVCPVRPMGPMPHHALPARPELGPDHSPVSTVCCSEGTCFFQTTTRCFSQERQTRQAASEIARPSTRVAPSTNARSTAIAARRRLIGRLKRKTTKYICAKESATN